MSALSSSSEVARQVAGFHRAGRSSARTRRHSPIPPYPHTLMHSSTRALEHWSTRATTPHVRAICPPHALRSVAPLTRTRRPLSVTTPPHESESNTPVRCPPSQGQATSLAKPQGPSSGTIIGLGPSTQRPALMSSCLHALMPSCTRATAPHVRAICPTHAPRTTERRALDEDTTTTFRRDTSPQERIECTRAMSALSSSSHIVRQVSGLHREGRSSDRKRRQSPHALIPSCTRALVLLRRTFGRSVPPRTTQRRALHEDTTTTFRRDTSPQERIECTRAMSALSSSRCTARSIGDREHAEPSTRRFTLPHRARWNLESTRAPSPRTEHTQPSSRDSRVRTPRSARAPTR